MGRGSPPVTSTVVILVVFLLTGREATRAEGTRGRFVWLITPADVVVDATLVLLVSPMQSEGGVTRPGAEGMASG